jgi:hypothetical protein
MLVHEHFNRACCLEQSALPVLSNSAGTNEGLPGDLPNWNRRSCQSTHTARAYTRPPYTVAGRMENVDRFTIGLERLRVSTKSSSATPLRRISPDLSHL